MFYDVLQDLRALQLLENQVGRERVVNLLEGTLEKTITLNDYLRDSEWLFDRREGVKKAKAQVNKTAVNNGIFRRLLTVTEYIVTLLLIKLI